MGPVLVPGHTAVATRTSSVAPGRIGLGILLVVVSGAAALFVAAPSIRNSLPVTCRRSPPGVQVISATPVHVGDLTSDGNSIFTSVGIVNNAHTVCWRPRSWLDNLP